MSGEITKDKIFGRGTEPKMFLQSLGQQEKFKGAYDEYSAHNGPKNGFDQFRKHVQKHYLDALKNEGELEFIDARQEPADDILLHDHQEYEKKQLELELEIEREQKVSKSRDAFVTSAVEVRKIMKEDQMLDLNIMKQNEAVGERIEGRQSLAADMFCEHKNDRDESISAADRVLVAKKNAMHAGQKFDQSKSFYNSDHSVIDSKENTGSFWNIFGSKKSTPADEVLKKVRIDAPVDDGTFDNAVKEDSSAFDDAAKKDSDDKMYDLEVRLALNELKDPPAGIKIPGENKNIFVSKKKSTPADEVLKKVRVDATLDDGAFDDAATENSSTFDDAAKKDSDDKMYDLEVRLALNKLKDPPARIKTPGKKKKEVIPPTPTRKSTRIRTPAKRDNRGTFG